MYGNWAQKFYYNNLLRSFALKSKALVTVSEFSQREIARWLGLSKESIDIVYNSMDSNYGLALSDDEVTSVLQRYGLKRKQYFICLSNPKPHKNIPLLVEAYRSYYQAVPKGQAIPLVLSMSEFADVPGILSVGGVPDGDARVLVSASKAVVFPSLYEGFGLPPVEAASMGTSVIVSQIDPHQEGLADLPPDEVTWVDPRDLKGWVKALGQAADDQLKPVSLESRTRLLARFDVKRMGQDMDLIYRRVLGLNS
jgi:glycosyltransferase involved in cell wall biosynthesis